MASLTGDCTALSATTASYGIYCLSEVRENKLMWSHYADEHRGVCLGIRTAALASHRIYPVHYTNDLPVVDISELVVFTENTFNKMALAKASDWEYEREWRTGHHPGVHTYSACVDEVIIGARVADETRTAISEAVKAAGHAIRLYEARLSDRHYQLDIVPLT
jgi:hypothetical protein